MSETQTQLQKTDETYNSPEALFQPAVDVQETKDGVVLFADLPGVERDQLDITLEKNILTLRARSAAPAPVEGASLIYGEYEPGTFERSFTVSAEVDRERIEAELKNGVLRLSLHKAPQHQPRKIQVRTE